MDRLREFGVAAHPVAVAPDVHDMAAVEQPVQQGGGHDFVAEDAALETLVTSQGLRVGWESGPSAASTRNRGIPKRTAMAAGLSLRVARSRIYR